jgi:hypothetical protein
MRISAMLLMHVVPFGMLTHFIWLPLKLALKTVVSPSNSGVGAGVDGHGRTSQRVICKITNKW